MNISKTVYNTLLIEWGHQDWWTATSTLDIMIGAILTQNTSWSQVEKAIQRLKDENALNMETLASIPSVKLESWIRSTGYYRQKASAIKRMCNTLIKTFNGSIETLFSLETQEL